MNILVILAVIAIAAIVGFAGYRKTLGVSIVPTSLVEMAYPVSEWEHGYKTSRVVGTRLHGDTMGWNAKFDFPQDAYDCDAADLSNYITSQGGWVYRGGGEPGAALYVKFKDIDNKEKLSQKIKEILPKLSKVMFAVANDLPTGVPTPIEYQWPNTAPPDKSDPCWQLNNNLRAGGINMSGPYMIGEEPPKDWYRPATESYHKAEVSPGKWQWVAGKEPSTKDANPRCEMNGGWSSSGGFEGDNYYLPKPKEAAAATTKL